MKIQAQKVSADHFNDDGETKMQDAATEPNIFRAILNSKLPDHEKKADRIAHEGLEVLLAGSATFARVMTTATFHILDQPGLKARLCEEVRRLMPDASVIPPVRLLESSALLVCSSCRALYDS